MPPVSTHAREERPPGGRIKLHPAVVQVVGGLLIFGASLIAGYYRGSADQAKETAGLGTRVSVLEERSKTLDRDLAEIKTDLKTLLRRPQ